MLLLRLPLRFGIFDLWASTFPFADVMYRVRESSDVIYCECVPFSERLKSRLGGRGVVSGAEGGTTRQKPRDALRNTEQ